jgi:hypothetical protein
LLSSFEQTRSWNVKIWQTPISNQNSITKQMFRFSSFFFCCQLFDDWEVCSSVHHSSNSWCNFCRKRTKVQMSPLVPTNNNFGTWVGLLTDGKGSQDSNSDTNGKTPFSVVPRVGCIWTYIFVAEEKLHRSLYKTSIVRWKSPNSDQKKN